MREVACFAAHNARQKFDGERLPLSVCEMAAP